MKYLHHIPNISDIKLKPGLHFARKCNRNEKQNQKNYAFFTLEHLHRFFLSLPPKLRQNTELKILNSFCFSRFFSSAAANRFLRLGSERPKHERHGFVSRYGVFCYWICVNYIIMNISTWENKGIIRKKNILNALISQDLVEDNPSCGTIL